MKAGSTPLRKQRCSTGTCAEKEQQGGRRFQPFLKWSPPFSGKTHASSSLPDHTGHLVITIYIPTQTDHQIIFSAWTFVCPVSWQGVHGRYPFVLGRRILTRESRNSSTICGKLNKKTFLLTVEGTCIMTRTCTPIRRPVIHAHGSQKNHIVEAALGL